MPKDRWQELCKSVEQDDGLPVREVGLWTEEKLWFWNRYLEITTSAMAGKPHWSGLVYVDLFAGPGICRIKSSRRRIPGSALIAANAPKPFRTILLCEKDKALAKACQTRLSRTAVADRCQVFLGDCNERVSEIASQIPERALTLAFVDPEGLDAEFSTIQTLANRGRVDLLILFADAYDVVRNIDTYRRQEHSKLDLTLGPGSQWREKWDLLNSHEGNTVRQFFAKIYQGQLQRLLGYKVFGERVISSRRGPLYRLIYASKHQRGLEFWDKVTKRDVGGQLDLGF